MLWWIIVQKMYVHDNQQCTDKPTLIDLSLEELHYHTFIINLDRCDESCNTVEDPINRI